MQWLWRGRAVLMVADIEHQLLHEMGLNLAVPQRYGH